MKNAGPSNRSKTGRGTLLPPGYFRCGIIVIAIFLLGVSISDAQSQKEKPESVGGPEHESHIYGVRIGMDLPTALEAVFVNADRQPGEEKPDALKKEGKNGKDVRVLYKKLPKGELQIVFADGAFVKEIALIYKKPPLVDDLRLPFSSTIGGAGDTANRSSANQDGVRSPAVLDGSTSIAEFGSGRTVGNEPLSAARVGNIERSKSDLLDGTRYDDRYSIGFTDNLKQQKIWWRDEETTEGYAVRIAFTGKKFTEAGARFVASIITKTIIVKPGDEKAFLSKVTAGVSQR